MKSQKTLCLGVALATLATLNHAAPADRTARASTSFDDRGSSADPEPGPTGEERPGLFVTPGEPFVVVGQFGTEASGAVRIGRGVFDGPCLMDFDVALRSDAPCTVHLVTASGRFTVAVPDALVSAAAAADPIEVDGGTIPPGFKTVVVVRATEGAELKAELGFTDLSGAPPRAEDPGLEPLMAVDLSPPPGSVFVLWPAGQFLFDPFKILGEGFGSDPLDLCVQVRDGDRLIGMARALDAAPDQVEAKITRVLPDAGSGKVHIALGDGTDAVPSGLPADMTVLESWTWRSVGNPAQVSTTSVDLDTLQALSSCGYITGVVDATDQQIVACIPSTETAPIGTAIDFTADVCTSGGTLAGDYSVSITNTTFWDATEIATNLCIAIQMSFFDNYGIFISCTVSSSGGDAKLTFSAPVGERFNSGGCVILICP